MKKTIYILVIVLIQTTSLLSQCCPYLGNFEIIPENPNSNDTIYLATDVSTPNLGVYLGYEVMDYGTDIIVTGCYAWGYLTAITTFKDTINLGVKQAGTYNLNYTAYESYDFYECHPIDENALSFSFEVDAVTSISMVSDFDINYYPNPVISDQVNIVSSQRIHDIELFDSQGKLIVFEYNINELEHAINMAKIPSGIYFLKISNKNNEGDVKKLIKY